MNVLHWLSGRFTNRLQALWLYRRGMKRAKKHDHSGAIEDYSKLIHAAETPVDVKAMALYNRALVHMAAGNEPRGTDDLNAVLAMDESAGNVRTMAKQKLSRMETRSHKRDAS